MYRFALETMGGGTPRGRDFADKWRYPGFRHAFRVTTVVWGLAFLGEAAAQIVIIETATTGTAKTTSNVMPLIVAAAIIAWNISYAKRGQRTGKLAEQAARARREAPPPMPPSRPARRRLLDIDNRVAVRDDRECARARGTPGSYISATTRRDPGTLNGKRVTATPWRRPDCLPK
jgi:hypothetical protein